MDVSVAQFQIFFLALTRILAVIIQVPVLGGNAVPNQVKIGLGIALALVIISWQPLPIEAESLPLFAFTIAIGQELLIGTLAGFTATLIFGILQVTGEMIGLTSGFAAGRVINPALQMSGSSINNFFFIIAVMYFILINGHHDVLIGLQRSFVMIPVNSTLPALTSNRLLSLTGGLIMTGVQMSLPVMGALLLTDITLGLLARVAPQIQVFFLGIPLKVGVGLLALLYSLNYLMPILSKLYKSTSVWMMELLSS